MLVDALGNPLKFIRTGGAAGDNPQAIPLLAGQQTQEVLADRGYDADATIAYIEEQLHATATIPPKQSRVNPRDWLRGVQRARLVECFITASLPRFDKYAKRFLAFIHFASMMVWLK